MLGISRAHAYELVRRGELPRLQLGRRVVVPRRALEDLVSSAGGESGIGPTREPGAESSSLGGEEPRRRRVERRADAGARRVKSASVNRTSSGMSPTSYLTSRTPASVPDRCDGVSRIGFPDMTAHHAVTACGVEEV